MTALLIGLFVGFGLATIIWGIRSGSLYERAFNAGRIRGAREATGRRRADDELDWSKAPWRHA